MIPDGLYIGPGIIARSPTALTVNGITHAVAANGDAFASGLNKYVRHEPFALHVLPHHKQFAIAVEVSHH